MIHSYINGNYQVNIGEDGTKTRVSLDGTFIPKRVETLDINISNKCSVGCKYCYINATSTGEDGDIDLLDDMDIPYDTELAVNYNGFHPQMEEFTRWYSKQRIVNITVNNALLSNSIEVKRIQSWIDSEKVKGIGISTNKFIPCAKLVSNNIVYHTIVGITPTSEIVKMLEANQKVLVLGFKQIGRGEAIQLNIKEWDITSILNVGNGILSFDNLALEQLDIENKIPSKVWEEHYMGDDGIASFYIDLVTKSFSKSSLDSASFKLDFEDLKISEMYRIIRRVK